MEVEVEYWKETEAGCRIWATHADETEVGLKPERGTRFSDDLERRGVENIASLDLTPGVGDGMADVGVCARMAIGIHRVTRWTS